MKRFTSLLFAIVLLVSFLLSSCSSKYYEEAEPTGREDITVARLGSHEVKYDMFRAFFLMYKDTGADDDTAKDLALSEIAYIFAVFDVCKDYKIKPESRNVRDEVDEMIKISIDGGEIDGVEYDGYGTFDKYLEAISDMYLTDRVNRTVTRAYICESKLKDKMEEPTEDEVRAYFASDDCIRITWLCTEYESVALTALSELGTKTDEMDKIRTLIKYNPAASAAYERGWYLGRHESGASFRPVADAAFSLDIGQYSDVIKDSEGNSYIVYRMEKDAGFINTNYDEVYASYTANEFNVIINARTSELLDSITFHGVDGGLSSISMEQ